MTHEQWDSTKDPNELIRHAAPLIPRQHLALVLAEIASQALPAWQRDNPYDWYVPWIIASLRAWGVGELPFTALRSCIPGPEDEDEDGLLLSPFVDEVGRPYTEYRHAELVELPSVAAGVAFMRAVDAVTTFNCVEASIAVIEAAAFAQAAAAEASAAREYEAWCDALDAEWDEAIANDDRRPDEDHPPEWYEAAAERREAEERAADKAQNAWKTTLVGALQASATTIHALVPFLSRQVSQWKVHGEIVLSGDMLLLLDGWRLVDAAHRDELGSLEASRLAAFDAAQTRSGFVLYQSAR